MKSFEKLYLETVDLFEEGLFRDSVWKNNLQSNLETLKTMWPTSDYLELSEMLKDNLWRIEQIFLWSYLDKETLEINLNEHSSLNFITYLK